MMPSGREGSGRARLLPPQAGDGLDTADHIMITLTREPASRGRVCVNMHKSRGALSASGQITFRQRDTPGIQTTFR
jgi:hypothetical protein